MHLRGLKHFTRQLYKFDTLGHLGLEYIYNVKKLGKIVLGSYLINQIFANGTVELQLNVENSTL